MCNGDCAETATASKPSNNNGSVRRATAVETVARVLDQTICEGCPSNDRWAKEMLTEAQLVSEARLQSQPIEAYVARKSRPVVKEFKRQSQSVNIELLDRVPPSQMDKIRAYLKAKIPHMLLIRSRKSKVQRRKDTCGKGALMCGCGQYSFWDYDRGVFWCSKCEKGHLDSSQRDMGQACPSLEQDGAGLFCKACGCGHRRDANLAIKTTMLFATCPRGLWPK